MAVILVWFRMINLSVSQYVLHAVLQSSQRNTRNKISGWNWGKKHYEFASDSKDYIMTCSNKHHGCKGSYFSWGNMQIMVVMAIPLLANMIQHQQSRGNYIVKQLWKL